MVRRLALLSAAACALGLAALPRPAAAADYPAYYGEGGPAFEREAPLGPPPPAWRHGPGPVVYDERDPGRHGWDGFRGGPGPVFVRPGPIGRPAFYGPRFAGPPVDVLVEVPPPRPRPIAMPDGDATPVVGAERGCDSEEVTSVTPAGWRKTVTRRTCYSR